MPVLRELITVLGFDVDSAEAAKAEKIFSGLKNGALAIVGATTAAAGGIFLMARQTAEFGDDIAKTSAEINVASGALQELQFAGELAGVSTQQLRLGLRFLSKNLGDAVQGSKAAQDTFSLLGISVRDSNGQLKATEDVLEEVAGQFEKMDDDGQKTALSLRLFGRAGARMAALLSQGKDAIQATRREARELGIVLDEETLANTEKFQDAMLRLDVVIKSFRNFVGAAVIPVIVEWTDKFRDLFVENRKLIQGGLGFMLRVVGGLINGMISLVRVVQENARFLKVLGLVVTATVVPGLLRLAASYALVAASALKAAVIAAAPFLLVAALAVLIALVIEDVFAFVSGGESAIGNLFNAFTAAAVRPDAHWMVQVLAAILEAIVDVIDMTGEFFRIWGTQSGIAGDAFEGLVNTLKMAWEGFVLFFKDQAVAAFEFVSRKAKELIDAIPLSRRLLDIAGPGTFLGRTFAPDTAPVPGRGGPTNVQTNVGGRSVSVSVDASSSTDPQAIADATAKKVDQILEDDRRETARILAPQVSR